MTKKRILVTATISLAAVLLTGYLQGASWEMLVIPFVVAAGVWLYELVGEWAEKQKGRERWVPFIILGSLLAFGLLLQVLLVWGGQYLVPLFGIN